jgi:hypothetical protein
MFSMQCIETTGGKNGRKMKVEFLLAKLYIHPLEVGHEKRTLGWSKPASL